MSAGRLVVLDEPALIRALADWVTGTAQRGIAARGRCAVGLAGGRTPQRVYEELATAPYAQAIDWAHIHVYFSDEQAVVPDHADSNYRMVHEALLGRVPIPAARIYRMEAERPDRDVAAVAGPRGGGVAGDGERDGMTVLAGDVAGRTPGWRSLMSTAALGD